jgi:hypothetical protein
MLFMNFFCFQFPVKRGGYCPSDPSLPRTGQNPAKFFVQPGFHSYRCPNHATERLIGSISGQFEWTMPEYVCGISTPAV